MGAPHALGVPHPPRLALRGALLRAPDHRPLTPRGGSGTPTGSSDADGRTDRPQPLLRRTGSRAGDESSLEGVYHRRGGLVRTVAAHRVGDVEEAKDVIRQVFVGARRSRGNLDPQRGALKTWPVPGPDRRVHRTSDRNGESARTARSDAPRQAVGGGRWSKPRKTSWR
ncbi:hypothetical protein DBP18_07905 [Streptomyces sp. CS081A]|nr:hypothetical protein DBP18_07905 [Streptomyces sp. CS081A]